MDTSANNRFFQTKRNILSTDGPVDRPCLMGVSVVAFSMVAVMPALPTVPAVPAVPAVIIAVIVVTVVTVVIVVVTVERPQEVLEGPVRHVPALPTRHCVREAEVDAVVDANVDHIAGHVREVMICARLRVSQRVGARDSEGHVIRPEEECERAGHRTNNVIEARVVVWVVRGVEKRLPGEVADGRRVAVVVTFLDGSERSPENG